MRLLILLVLGGVFLAGFLSAQEVTGDREAGRKLAGMCRTCHGLDGLARIPIAPHIGGEPAAYLAAQLRAFRSGARQHEMMSVVAARLTDAQINDVSAWYGGHQISAELTADPADAPQLCVACHGADGIASFSDAPHLAGENTIYIETQLKAFRSGKRDNAVMTAVATDLDDAQLREIATWFAEIGISIEEVAP